MVIDYIREKWSHDHRRGTVLGEVYSDPKYFSLNKD